MKEFIAARVCEVEVTDEESIRRPTSGVIRVERAGSRCSTQRHVEIQSAPAGEFFKRVPL